MNSKHVQIVICGLLLLHALPGGVAAKSCSAMKKELAELRAEYHEYAKGEGPKGEGVKFERLAEVLDKIIDLKRAMTEIDCKIPPRTPVRTKK